MPEYIEREALIEVFRRIEKDKTDCFSPFANTLIDFIKLVPPTADVVKVKHGKWTKGVDETFGCEYVSCSKCGEELYPAENTFTFDTFYNFCPYCGAKMDKE